MNGENNHIFHTSALDSAPDEAGRQPYARALFAVQLWVLVAFVGMSLFAIGARLLLEGARSDEPEGLVLALAGGTLVAGVVLALSAWGKAEQLLGRTKAGLAGRDRPGRAGDHAPRMSVNASPAPAHARITGITPTL
jgi:hypothetical protein